MYFCKCVVLARKLLLKKLMRLAPDFIRGSQFHPDGTSGFILLSKYSEIKTSYPIKERRKEKYILRKSRCQAGKIP